MDHLFLFLPVLRGVPAGEPVLAQTSLEGACELARTEHAGSRVFLELDLTRISHVVDPERESHALK